MNPYQCKACGGRHAEKVCPVCVDAAKKEKTEKSRKR